ncbi:MAG: ATP synthase subunit I [Clostridiales bacterium]|nr:ATP synthase subunit I [Clostridiales bacterium]
MESRKLVFSQTLVVLAGEIFLSAVMVGIFALAGHFDRSVLLGAVVGALLAAANFFLMALSADCAADKAEKQNVKGGQALIQLSYIGRLIGLFLVLVLCALTKIFNLFALVIPLVFTRPILTVSEFLKKKGEKNS